MVQQPLLQTQKRLQKWLLRLEPGPQRWPDGARKRSPSASRLAVLQELRHNNREIQHSSNSDIDPARSADNDDLTPDHDGLSPYEYYKARMAELYIFDPRRTDINTAFGWVVTLPIEISDPVEEQQFFAAVADFLKERYGPQNCVSITVHRDEGGQPHLHYIGIPAVANNMRSEEHPQTEKLSCKEVINRAELRVFHSDLQKYLDEHGVNAQVHTGVAGGNNRTVEQLKRETAADLRAEIDRLHEVERNYNTMLQERTMQQHERSRWDRSENKDRERGRF